MPIIPLNFFKLNLFDSNQLNLMYETDSVDTQVKILSDHFLLALESRLLCSIGNEIKGHMLDG